MNNIGIDAESAKTASVEEVFQPKKAAIYI